MQVLKCETAEYVFLEGRNCGAIDSAEELGSDVRREREGERKRRDGVPLSVTGFALCPGSQIRS